MTSPLRRQTGIAVPLFSLTSSRSWGIGEFADLPAFGAWCAAAGQAYVQLLPLNEISPGETSPYSSMTAMALDPLYIHVPDVPEFVASGGEAALLPAQRDVLASLRADTRVRYGSVRELKRQCLRAAYVRFRDEELSRDTARARDFHAYASRESWWLDVYTTFRAVHAAEQERAWWDWPLGLAYADPEALRQANASHADDRLYRAYQQWVAEAQWQAARAAAGVRVFGDLPFMVSGDSPDVWARKNEFMLDATVGVPPDAFSETGQDWGLPPWRWDVMQGTGFQWMRARARRTAALFDGVRIDHLVGLYRIYVRPTDEARAKVFSPPDERSESPARTRCCGCTPPAASAVPPPTSRPGRPFRRPRHCRRRCRRYRGAADQRRAQFAGVRSWPVAPTPPPRRPRPSSAARARSIPTPRQPPPLRPSLRPQSSRCRQAAHGSARR